MKFDIVVGNPPYDGNLHLKIINTVIKFLKPNAVGCFIHPSNWFFHKDRLFRKYREVAEHIYKIYTIDKIDSQHLFSVWCYGGVMVSLFSPNIVKEPIVVPFDIVIQKSDKFRQYHHKYYQEKRKTAKKS